MYFISSFNIGHHFGIIYKLMSLNIMKQQSLQRSDGFAQPHLKKCGNSNTDIKGRASQLSRKVFASPDADTAPAYGRSKSLKKIQLNYYS